MTLYGLNQLITNFHQPTKLCQGLWSISHSSLKVPSPDHLLQLNLKIEYPPPYTRKIWDYNRAETDLINRSIESFDWSKLFLDKDVHEQVTLFNKTILNIFRSFTPSKLIICDDKDHP